MKRRPAVAGQFYPSSRSELTKQVEGFIDKKAEKARAVGLVSPHAGLMYSGGVAGAVYSRIEFPHTFIIMGPNHTGLGSPVSIMSSSEWQMPTGELNIDSSIASRIKEKMNIVEEDSMAHRMEHSLEVQLPFILYYSSTVNIVPITLMIDSLDLCHALGDTLAEVIRKAAYPVTIIASSDMSHYETDTTARAKDKKAIERIVDMDPEGLYHTVRKEKISMCGVVPVTTMLFAARKLGAKEAVLVKYMTSGETSGDYDYVVGYSGIIVK